ncbi:MAG: alkaline phosphatase family protein [Actinobacteria bacterium]|nr:alkaline phosphatase family protein [Actinomycetota bacterium]
MHLADITPSIFAGLGLSDVYDSCGFGESPQGRDCLLLVDGLGADVIEKYGEFAPTLSRLTFFPPILTAFPTTTATSLTTLMTGTLPGTHGMLGYTVRVPRSGGRILNSLKWDERVDPRMWQPVPTLFERGSAVGITVSHVASRRYENTGFTQAAFRGATYRGANILPEMVEEAKNGLKRAPSFTYLYLNDLDVAGHSSGVGSEKWLLALAFVDHAVKTLLDQLPKGTRFWLTSDHGMVNVEGKIILGHENSLLEGISLVAGEPRARHLYLEDRFLKGSGPDEIAENWRTTLGESIEIYTRREAINANLFGLFISNDASDRMGDLIAFTRGGLILIDPLREKLESMMVGHHGALTDAEKFVPLGFALIP